MVCKKMHENYPFDSLEAPPHPTHPHNESSVSI